MFVGRRTDETSIHYLYQCSDYNTPRQQIHRNTMKWDNVIKFIDKTERHTSKTPLRKENNGRFDKIIGHLNFSL